MALSGDKILKHAGHASRREVHVPAWADEDGDDVVIVRSMTMREFEIFQKTQQASGKDSATASAGLVARCVIDSDGQRVFKDADVANINELGAGDVGRLTDAIVELSGLTDGSKVDVEGNSDAAESGDSSSS